MEFTTLKRLENEDPIDKKINNPKDPTYLPHVSYAWARYQTIFTLPGKRKIKAPSKSAPSTPKINKESFMKRFWKKKRKKNNMKTKPNIDQSETTETEGESSVDNQQHDMKNIDEDSDDTDPEYPGFGCSRTPRGYGNVNGNGNENEEKEEIRHLQYSLIIFPKLLNDNETRMYITKQGLFIGNGFMSFKRSDIIDLIPRLFDHNKYQKYLAANFIKALEEDYGNEKRKRYFYDQKFIKEEQEFNSFEPKGK